MDILTEINLFSGAGGGLLGWKILEAWGGPRIRTLCYVEHNEYRQRILKQRVADGILDDAPIWDDVRSFDGKPWRGVDLVSGGFPCQPFSGAGKQQGESDDRNMWPETIRIIREVRPRFAFLENVPGLLSVRDGEGWPYFGRILRDLAEGGYDARWTVLGADDAGAPHKRKRLWIMAHPTETRLDAVLKEDNGTERGREGQAQWCQDRVFPEVGQKIHTLQNAWPPRPDPPRVANGMALWVERLKSTGDGQVPCVAALAFLELFNERIIKWKW